MSVKSLLYMLDSRVGGRNAGMVIPASEREHPKTRKAFTWIFWLLLVELILGIGAVLVALTLSQYDDAVPFVVWMRTVVVLLMTLTLFYFAWRARQGWLWAYQRLRLFTQIFPVVTLVMAAIPGLYPGWLITEQILFSLVMIGIADFLTSEHMRNAYRKREVNR